MRKLFYILISFFINLSSINSQNLEFEKSINRSFDDRFYSIINFNNKYLSSGLTYKDSLFNQNLGIYNVQFVVYSVNDNGAIQNKVNLVGRDTIIINNDSIPLLFDFEAIKTNFSEINKRIIITQKNLISTSPIQLDCFAMTMDTNGLAKWFTYLNLYPLTEPKGIYETKVMPNGQIHVVGWISSGSNADCYLSKLDENGNLLFTRRYFIPEYQAAYKISELSDGSVLMSGRSDSSAMFFKVNPINGDSILMHTSLTIPTGDNTNLDVKYFGERSNNTYLAMIYDGQNQGFICTLDTNFNLLTAFPTNANYDNFFRVNDSEFVGYKEDAPVSVYSFDEYGNENWNLQLTNPEYVNFTPDGNGGLMGAGNVEDANGNSDFYLVRIDSVGYPAPTICHNPPAIQSTSASISTIGGTKHANVGAEAIENLKYSDVLAYNWYFQDGYTQFNQYVTYDFDETIYPDSFWCMAVVTDGIGCTDTITIDTYTGNVIYPNPNWPPNSVEEKISNLNSIRKLSIYPNPFTSELIIDLNNYITDSYSIMIYDLEGREVLSKLKLYNQSIINLNRLTKGAYLVKVKTSDFIYTERIVKK